MSGAFSLPGRTARGWTLSLEVEVVRVLRLLDGMGRTSFVLVVREKGRANHARSQRVFDEDITGGLWSARELYAFCLFWIL